MGALRWIFCQINLFFSQQAKRLWKFSPYFLLSEVENCPKLHFYHFPPTTNFLSALEMTDTQVWYILGIVSSSPTVLHSEKIGLIMVTYDPLSVLGLINNIVTYTQVWYIIGIISSSPTDFHSEKIGLIRVTYAPWQY